MERNVGGTERTARIVLGLLFLVLAVVTVALGGGLGQQTQLIVAVVSLLASAIFLVTAGTRKCPVNSTLGRNTYLRESRL